MPKRKRAWHIGCSILFDTIIPIHGAHLQTTSNGLKENLRESFYGEKIVYVVDILYFCNIIYV